MSPAWEGEQRDEHGRWSSGGPQYELGSRWSAGGVRSGFSDPMSPFKGPNELAPEDRPEEWGFNNTAQETLSDAQVPLERPGLESSPGKGPWERWEAVGNADNPGYQQINEVLRDEANFEPTASLTITQEARPELDAAIEGLDREIEAQQPIARDITLYRSMKGEAAEAYGELRPGDGVTEPSFVSTTPTEAYAHEFGEVQANKTTSMFSGGKWATEGARAVMRVDVEAGTKVLAPNATSESTAEAVLPRGGTLTNVGPMHFRYGAP